MNKFQLKKRKKNYGNDDIEMGQMCNTRSIRHTAWSKKFHSINYECLSAKRLRVYLNSQYGFRSSQTANQTLRITAIFATTNTPPSGRIAENKWSLTILSIIYLILLKCLFHDRQQSTQHNWYDEYLIAFFPCLQFRLWLTTTEI